MSLASALNTAQNSLLNVARQTNIVSRNITDAGNENYASRNGVIASNGLGSRIVSVRSSAEPQLVRSHLQALADGRAQGIISTELSRLNLTLNGVEGATSPATLLTRLHDSLQTLTTSPSDELQANAVIADAKLVADGLSNASAALQTFRSSLDSQIAHETSKLNDLLSKFEAVNAAVVNGTRSGQDVNDALDQRDTMLREISQIVPVNILTREGNDVVLVTKGGATLFETLARPVTFDPIASYSPATVGNTIRIDGVPVAPGQGANTDAGGSLGALLQLRDTTAGTIQTQIDETARGLIATFAETDATGGGNPPLAGLFTWSGGPALPPSGTAVTGLAADLRVNAAYDPQQGGDIFRLRDGGANGAIYNHNPTGAASYSDHVIALAQRHDVEIPFDSTTMIGGSKSLMTFASHSMGWIDGMRSEAHQAASTKEAFALRLSEKISNATGVNIDEEMSMLLQLEHSYEASARLMSAVDEMLQTLLAAVR